MDLGGLPIKLLKRILDCLSYEEIAKLRGSSTRFHCAAREILNNAFRELGARLQTHRDKSVVHQAERDASAAFRGRVLRLLRSEHSILLAFSRRYLALKNGCFFAGKILDLFDKLARSRTAEDSPEVENNRVAELLLLVDQYLDWLERHELSSEERCSWFGACVVDLLDSYLTSRYHLVAARSGSTVKLTGQYTIEGYAEAPPQVGDPLGRRVSTQELVTVLRYLRKHARWHNFATALQHLYRESDSVAGLEDEREKIYTRRTSLGYEVVYKKKIRAALDENSSSNVVSLRAIINLRCHTSVAPARLIDEKAFLAMACGESARESSSSENSARVEPTWVVENESEGSCTTARSFLEEASWLDSRGTNDQGYCFSLELRSVHPKKLTERGLRNCVKFGETILNIKHTSESVFAAQSECLLY